MNIVIGVVALVIGILIGTFLIGSSSTETNTDNASSSIGGVPGTLDGAETSVDIVWFSNLTGIVQSIDTQQVTIAVESPQVQGGTSQPLVSLPIQFHPDNTSPVNEYRQDNTTGSVDALPASLTDIAPGNRVGLNIKRETTGALVVEQIIIYTTIN